MMLDDNQKTSLSPKQIRFFEFMGRSSISELLFSYFDIDKASFKPDFVEQTIDSLSSGEQIMLRFFLGVWRNQNQFDFDLFDAFHSLDEGNFCLIQEWVSDPFFP